MKSIRVCRKHLYPVGLTQDAPEFVCLLKYERLEIEGTRVMPLDTTQPFSQLVRMVTARGDCETKRKDNRSGGSK